MRRQRTSGDDEKGRDRGFGRKWSMGLGRKRAATSEGTKGMDKEEGDPVGLRIRLGF
jgi:hypothetical protein